MHPVMEVRQSKEVPRLRRAVWVPGSCEMSWELSVAL